MEQVKRFWKRLKDFDNESDYFWFVDTICLLFEQRPPITKLYRVKATWVTLTVLHFFQYICYAVQLFRCLSDSPLDGERLTVISNLFFVLTVAILRGLCLAYHRDDMLKLKHYLNAKICRRNEVHAFEVRKSMYQKINRYAAVFHFVTTCNSCMWAFTTGLQEDVVQIPVDTSGLPFNGKMLIDICFTIVFVPWSYTLWYSPTQFIPMLKIVHTELSIIVDQFEGMFEKVVANYALRPNDLDKLPPLARERFWAELDREFKSAISHHSEFIRMFKLLQNTSSLNFFIFLCSSAVIITFNIFLFIIEPSIGRIPLQLLAFQYISETYLCCTMFESLETENERITKYIYAIDWLHSASRRSSSERMHGKSIYTNANLLLQQVRQGLDIRAGGIFALNLSTFSRLMKSVYSLLTLLLQLVVQ